MSQNPGKVIFAENKTACGSWEDLNQAHTCHKCPGTSFSSNKKDPADGKTSTKLIHVTKSQELHLCRRKKASGSRDDLSKANTDHKISGTSTFCQKEKQMRQPERPQQSSYISRKPKNAYAEKHRQGQLGRSQPGETVTVADREGGGES